MKTPVTGIGRLYRAVTTKSHVLWVLAQDAGEVEETIPEDIQSIEIVTSSLLLSKQVEHDLCLAATKLQ